MPKGKAIPGTDETPAEYRYQRLLIRKSNLAAAFRRLNLLALSRGTVDRRSHGLRERQRCAEDPTSEAPAPGDVDAGGVVSQIKVDAESSRTAKQLDDNVGYLTSGAIRLTTTRDSANG